MASIYRITNITAPQCLRYKTPTSTTLSANRYYTTTNKSIKPTTKKPERVSAAAIVNGLSSAAGGGRRFATLGQNAGLYNILRNQNILSRNLCSSSLIFTQQQQFRNFSSLQIALESQPTKLVHHNAMAPLKNRRYISSREITKNLTLYTNGQFKNEVDPKTLEFKLPASNPLVLMMSWLMAKQKHLRKYAEIYTEMGFDVMVVHITPWQLLWPVKGTQIVAAETLKFLENNTNYSPIVIHGFSVGAYQFGEMMLQMSRDMERYKQVLDRIICQIWDSAADITEIPVGLPKSIFPRNPRMQSALRNYTLYHLKTFHNQATIHYMRSSQMFHSTLVKKPALFFVSDNDLVGPPASNNAVRENWERADINVTFKCWKHSLHASHLIKHRDEYLEILFKHLENCGVFDSIGLKSRAKL